jgi:hypothetical protein
MGKVGVSGGEDVLPATTEQVLLAEYELIWGESAPADEAAYRREILKKDQAALCLSGGGIRSAAFALGVLQALSRKKLLTQFHYLSTVSGGGYIGSWLQRWIAESKNNVKDVMTSLGSGGECREIRTLRENSNFITPRVGLGSNDTWTAVAMSLRNIAINWLLFLPLLLMVAIFPNLFRSGVISMAPNAGQYTIIMFGFAALATAAVAYAAWFTCAGMPSYRDEVPVSAGQGDGWLFKRIVAPLIIWAVFSTLVLATDLIGTASWLDAVPAAGRRYMLRKEWMPEGGLVIIPTFAAMFLAFLLSGIVRGRKFRHTFFSDAFPTLLALLTPPLLIWAGAALFQALAPPLPAGEDFSRHFDRTAADWRAILLTVLAPVWLLGTHLTATIIFVANRRPKGQNVKPDADREWLARLSAVKAKPMLLWIVAGGSALLLNQALDAWAASYDMSLASLLAVVAGVTAVAGAKNQASGDAIGAARQKIGKAAGFVRKLPLQAIVAIAAFLFIVLLFLILARLEWAITEPIAFSFENELPFIGRKLPEFIDPHVVAHSILFVGLLLLAAYLSYRIEANRFSLHGLYRNRLARGFLGAARLARKPDAFTGFDPNDNMRMHKLAPTADGETRLYPVVNAALNVTASENLAWQERKAEPFVFTPHYSGSGMLPNERVEAVEGASDGRRDGAYIPSTLYGGSEPDSGRSEPDPGAGDPDSGAGDRDDLGISLATAMTISGAAASPNMGYNSSPAAAFLMTLFNVRLGAWLPNPARAQKLGDGIGWSSPNNSLRALLRELGGSTDDRGLDIYLSDGGHFENLCIYEMVRRRCRLIVVTDAGQDGECAFVDLGNAVRKVKIDFNVDISFGEMHIYRREMQPEPGVQLAWALGTIRYPEASSPDKHGKILYLKPSYFGPDLPIDVVSYAKGSAAFPHESTGDQFFSESQFESYRRLGDHFMSRIGLTPLDGEPPELTLAYFFDRVKEELAGKEKKNR